MSIVSYFMPQIICPILPNDYPMHYTTHIPHGLFLQVIQQLPVIYDMKHTSSPKCLRRRGSCLEASIPHPTHHLLIYVNESRCIARARDVDKPVR